jgi:N-acetylneuraminic acid mutarotase
MLTLLAALLLATPAAFAADNLAPLPSPVTNNAVTSVRINGQTLIYSLMGVGPAKDWKSISNGAYALNVGFNKWTTIRAVPGSGRLGAVAVTARQQVLLMGGFVPDQSGREAVISDLSIYDPTALKWYRGPDLPTPVRDAVGGVYRDRFVYMIGGFGKNGPVNDVQIYDAEAQRWLQGTSYPGPPVFGHAGTVVGDSIIYVDGAKKNPAAGPPNYVASDECWVGKIDRKNPRNIQWSKLPAHPGQARYRIAAGGADRDNKAYFAGGSATVYDYNGIGLDKVPAQPSATVFAYDFRSNGWQTIQENDPNPSMDHRALIVTGNGLVIVGGMGKDQTVLATVRVIPKGK